MGGFVAMLGGCYSGSKVAGSIVLLGCRDITNSSHGIKPPSKRLLFIYSHEVVNL